MPREIPRHIQRLYDGELVEEGLPLNVADMLWSMPELDLEMDYIGGRRNLAEILGYMVTLSIIPIVGDKCPRTRLRRWMVCV